MYDRFGFSVYTQLGSIRSTVSTVYTNTQPVRAVRQLERRGAELQALRHAQADVAEKEARVKALLDQGLPARPLVELAHTATTPPPWDASTTIDESARALRGGVQARPHPARARHGAAAAGTAAAHPSRNETLSTSRGRQAGRRGGKMPSGQQPSQSRDGGNKQKRPKEDGVAPDWWPASDPGRRKQDAQRAAAEQAASEESLRALGAEVASKRALVDELERQADMLSEQISLRKKEISKLDGETDEEEVRLYVAYAYQSNQTELL